MEMERQMYGACFTGHRPEKLTRTEQMIKSDLEKEILRAISDGVNVFITGMARGVDIWAAEIVLKLRDVGYPIQLICACPYNGFERGWKQEWKEKYQCVLTKADKIIYICDGYSFKCYYIRNKWMVDHSKRVIAVFNGEKGGTKNTIHYADKVGVPVVSIDG